MNLLQEELRSTKLRARISSLNFLCHLSLNRSAGFSSHCQPVFAPYSSSMKAHTRPLQTQRVAMAEALVCISTSAFLEKTRAGVSPCIVSMRLGGATVLPPALICPSATAFYETLSLVVCPTSTATRLW